MMKSKTMERVLRALITLLGAGIGAAIAMLMLPIVTRMYPDVFSHFSNVVLVYVTVCALGTVIFFALSQPIINRCMRISTSIEQHWEKMPTRQIILTSAGLLLGLVIAALVTQLILSVGASLLTVSFSALTYVFLGYIGMHIGYRRYRADKSSGHFQRRGRDAKSSSDFMDDAAALLDEAEDDTPMAAASPPASPKKYLDTSVVIDGRILDIAKTGFLEGEIVIPGFVLAELRHIADSGDGLRRARGRRGLDVLNNLQRELKNPITVDESDYPDVDEVDVKLLRLCRDNDGVVVTNDYNLNKVAGVSGIKVLNINDLANAVKPMLMAGEDMTVQIVREGKEPGQGVAYLDDGTMIVVENGRRYVGDTVSVTVTTVLQTSAGRMIFTKLKGMDEKAG